jgi:hypothetical protein
VKRDMNLSKILKHVITDFKMCLHLKKLINYIYISMTMMFGNKVFLKF